MAALGQYLLSSFSSGLSALSMASSVTERANKVPHEPSGLDVLNVKDAILHASRNPLPNELIDSIIDAAEYWPCTVVSTTRAFRATGQPHGGPRVLNKQLDNVLVVS